MKNAIISPAFNVGPHINEFVNSCRDVVDQIVIINDGSTDNTFSYLEEQKKNYA